MPRSADITIGDFWGLTKHNSKYNKDMGTNVVFINSEKGKQYFDVVKKRINYESQPLEWAISGNPRLLSSITQLSNKRTEFFDDIESKPFDEVVKKYSFKQRRTLKGFIKGCLGVTKKVYRIGGDEFVMIVEGATEEIMNEVLEKGQQKTGKKKIG